MEFLNLLTTQSTEEINLLRLLMQLVISGLLGSLIAFHVSFLDEIRHRNKKLTVARAQVIICMGGALLITVIGDNVARAFGIFGIASFMRFRTPVNNATDGAVLFILLGIGMAVGMEIYRGAIGATAFFYLAIWILMKLHTTPMNQRDLLTKEGKESSADPDDDDYDDDDDEYKRPPKVRGKDVGQGPIS